MAMFVCDFRVSVNGDNRWVDKGNRLLTLVRQAGFPYLRKLWLIVYEG